MPFLLTILGWLKNPYVLLCLAASCIVGYLYFHNQHQNTTIAKQATQITTLQAVAKSDKAVIAEKGDETKRAVTHTVIKDQIINAPKEDNASVNGSIPAVLLHTFDSLRAAHTSAAN